MSSIRIEDQDAPIRRFNWNDGKHVPHWERPGQSRHAHAGLEVRTHSKNNYLSFYASEYGDRSGKTTMITLSAEEGRAFFDWLKTVYEPADAMVTAA